MYHLLLLWGDFNSFINSYLSEDTLTVSSINSCFSKETLSVSTTLASLTWLTVLSSVASISMRWLQQLYKYLLIWWVFSIFISFSISFYEIFFIHQLAFLFFFIHRLLLSELTNSFIIFCFYWMTLTVLSTLASLKRLAVSSTLVSLMWSLPVVSSFVFMKWLNRFINTFFSMEALVSSTHATMRWL